MVTDIIWKRCSLQTPFLDKEPLSVPPTMLATNWSMSSLTFLSEASKAFHRKGDKFMPVLVEGHLSYTSVVVALSRLRSGDS